MWRGKRLRRADCLAGLTWIFLGISVLGYAWLKLPIGGTYGGVDNPWYASPAVAPLFAAILFIFGGLAVLLRGIRAGGFPGLPQACWHAVKQLWHPPARQGVFAVVWLATYFLLLRFHWLPSPRGENYIASSVLFLIGFALTFYRPNGRRPEIGSTLGIVGGAVALALAVAIAFSRFLHVPLP